MTKIDISKLSDSEVADPSDPNNWPDKLHPSHETRISDASSFDEICIHCGMTDRLGSWGNLRFPCKGNKSGRWRNGR
jgi:hypothetical protein